MNLERLPNEEKLSLCRKYYLGGFAFLPFLWLVNVVWFFREAFLKPAYTEQLQIKAYVKRSALGLLLWVAVLTTWITIYQHFRAEWGEVGDYLSFTIPLGIPWGCFFFPHFNWLVFSVKLMIHCNGPKEFYPWTTVNDFWQLFSWFLVN